MPTTSAIHIFPVAGLVAFTSRGSRGSPTLTRGSNESGRCFFCDYFRNYDAKREIVSIFGFKDFDIRIF